MFEPSSLWSRSRYCALRYTDQSQRNLSAFHLDSIVSNHGSSSAFLTNSVAKSYFNLRLVHSLLYTRDQFYFVSAS